MLHPRLRTVLDHKCQLGEGPVWDDRQQRIMWVDILQGDIHQYDVATGTYRTFNVGEMIGSFALRKSGGLIAAMQSGFAFVDPEQETVRHIADPEAHLADNRFNEGKCDPAGRFWAGTMSLHDQPNVGALYTLQADGSVQRKITGVSISNGLAWSLDGWILYHIDTPTHEIAAYDYDAATSGIKNRRIVIQVPHEFGSPDGMTIDTEGMLWVAHWDGWQIIRWDPATGAALLHIEIPAARVTSCTFGGDDYGDLYITCARTGLSDEQLAEQPLAGSLFVIKDCGFKGFPPDRYAG